MDCKAGQALKTQIYQKVEQLIQQGHEISVCWVPSHCKVERNDRADKAAKEAAGRERIQTARCTGLTHLKGRITGGGVKTAGGMAQTKDKRARKSEERVLCSFLESINGSSTWQNKKVLCFAILPTEDGPRGYWHILQKNRSNRDRRVLVVWRRRAIRHTPVHKVPEMKGRTASFKEEPR